MHTLQFCEVVNCEEIRKNQFGIASFSCKLIDQNGIELFCQNFYARQNNVSSTDIIFFVCGVVKTLKALGIQVTCRGILMVNFSSFYGNQCRPFEPFIGFGKFIGFHSCYAMIYVSAHEEQIAYNTICANGFTVKYLHDYYV